MPLYPPSPASNVGLNKWRKGFPGVEQSDSAVIAANGNNMFDVWVALNGSHAGVESKAHSKIIVHASCTRHPPFIGDNRLFKTLPYIPYFEP